jgi:8-oxo-dGTP pyrophosphatase MutT (NUDIX family)
MKSVSRRLAAVPLPDRPHQLPARRIRLAQLRKLRDCEQVAAVCYRVRGASIEFLLIRTRNNGRWTFPKGSSEPGLTHAQAAALEAFEEAGVHGRIEEVAFTRYIRRKRRGTERKDSLRSAGEEIAVNAHLCEVLRLSSPKESNRDRTWFSAADAKLRLEEGRAHEDGAEFARVVDKAVMHIRQLPSATVIVGDRSPRVSERQCPPHSAVQWKDALQIAQIEPPLQARGRIQEGAFMAYMRWQGGEARQSAGALATNRRRVVQGELLQFGRPREKKPKALANGSS